MQHQTRFISTALAVALAVVATSCGDAHVVNTLHDQAPEEETQSVHLEGDEIRWIVDPAEAEQLFEGDAASFKPDQPFRSAHLMVASASVALSYQLVGEDGAESEWQTIALEGVDADAVQGLVLTDEPAVELRLRKSGQIDFARVAFFDARLPEDYTFEHGHSSAAHEVDGDQPHDQATQEHALETRGQELRKAIPGRWHMPASIERIARGQYVPVTNAGRWRGPSGCSGGFTRGANDLKQHLQRHFPGIRVIYGYSCRPINCGTNCTSSQMSVHATGRAIDIMIPPFSWTNADNGHGDPIAHYLVTNAKRLGIQRVIWDRSIWDRAELDSYRGHPHADHLHVEITPQAARGITNFPPIGAGAAPRYKVDLSTSFHGGPINDGLSVSAANVPAVFNHAPRHIEAELLLTNRSNVDLENVVIGYWIEQPYLKASSYRIQDDHPAHDKRSWDTNSADGDHRNPAKNSLGKTGYLHMHKFSPNESKRVVLTLNTASSSIGLADHPDVRFWIKHVDNVYGEQVGFHDQPTNANKFGARAVSFAQLDVLDRDAWHFAGDHPSETLGWTGLRDTETVKLNMHFDALAVRTNGDDPAVVSPEWTQIHPWRWDQMVLKVRSHNGPHRMAVYWAHEDEGFSEAKSTHFDFEHGDSQFQYVVVPLDRHPGWEQGQDVIRRLRIDPHEDVQFGSGDSRWYDIEAVFFQDSQTRRTNSDIADFVDADLPGRYHYVRIRPTSASPSGFNDIIRGYELDAVRVNAPTPFGASAVNSVVLGSRVSNALGLPDNTTCGERESTLAGISDGGKMVLRYDAPIVRGDTITVVQQGAYDMCAPSGRAEIAVSEDGYDWHVIGTDVLGGTDLVVAP